MTGQHKSLAKETIYWFIVFLLAIPTRLFFRLRIRGRKKIAAGGEYIVVARHRSYWDVPILTVALGWPNRVHFIARKGLLPFLPFLQPVIRACATIIDRDHFSRGDFRLMLDAIRSERLIGLFPEGTTRMQVDARQGAIRFARLTGKALLPVNISADGPYPPRYPFRFPKVTASIGEPVTVDELAQRVVASERRAELDQQLSVALMEYIDAV
ncbi:1-acyl-sn-glycerol-3-phosphate acyltransferase [Candidatus Bipolaricaulota bacterium]|nr:1-acyl-sn-glycerol-3-phosphate acyltransferase [Candidatus Bipolaricaulota bacterium]